MNFEYVDEAKATTEEAAQKRAMETLNSSEKTHFWEVLLRDKYQEHKKEFNALGKRKRNRKSVCDSNTHAIVFYNSINLQKDYYFLLSFIVIMKLHSTVSIHILFAF